MLLVEQSLNLEGRSIVVPLKMEYAIKKWSMRHLFFSQAWCSTEPTLTVTPIQVSQKRLERAQSSCWKLTLRSLTFPSELRKAAYEMGNKSKTHTAMQSKIAALYTVDVFYKLLLHFLMKKNSVALYKKQVMKKTVVWFECLYSSRYFKILVCLDAKMFFLFCDK